MLSTMETQWLDADERAAWLRLAAGDAGIPAAASRIERASGARVDPLLAVSTSEGRIVVRLRGLLTALGPAATTLDPALVARRRNQARAHAISRKSAAGCERVGRRGAA